MCILIGTENSHIRTADVTLYTCNNLSTFGFYVHCILYPYCQLYFLVLLTHCVLHACFQFYLLHSSCNVAELSSFGDVILYWYCFRSKQLKQPI